MPNTWNCVVGSASFNYLTEAEKNSNALLLANILRGKGWNDIAIAGLFGSVSIEGIFNPGQCEVNYGVPTGNQDTSYNWGLGFIQWTKPSGGNINPLLQYAYDNNANWWDGDLQAEYLDHCDDPSYTYYLWGWLQDPDYPYTFQQFKTSMESPAQAAKVWLYNVERPGHSDSEAIRAEYAEDWYNFLRDSAYTPRLDYTGTDTSPYYTTYNPYWSWTIEDGERVWLGMNNCTAYAFGRWNELAQVSGYNTRWPLGDGANWVRDGIAKGYQSGNVPQLGAAISWKKYDGEGVLISNHVAIVEEIQYDGNGNPVSFTISQSAFNHNRPAPDRPDQRGPNQVGYNYFPWFWTDTVYMNNLDFVYGSGSFQGFLYHPSISPVPTPPIPPVPPGPSSIGRKMPFIFYLKRHI